MMVTPAPISEPPATEPSPRVVSLGGRSIRLQGAAPSVGRRLVATFEAPRLDRARCLSADDLKVGLHIVATLPNVRKRECALQIARLEKHVESARLRASLHYVTADDDSAWEVPASLHPGLPERAHCLLRAPLPDREAFKEAFGVGVVGERRIARGLFALTEGVFSFVAIPQNQLEGPSVKLFVTALAKRVELEGRGCTPPKDRP